MVIKMKSIILIKSYIKKWEELNNKKVVFLSVDRERNYGLYKPGDIIKVAAIYIPGSLEEAFSVFAKEVSPYEIESIEEFRYKISFLPLDEVLWGVRYNNLDAFSIIRENPTIQKIEGISELKNVFDPYLLRANALGNASRFMDIYYSEKRIADSSHLYSPSKYDVLPALIARTCYCLLFAKYIRIYSQAPGLHMTHLTGIDNRFYNFIENYIYYDKADMDIAEEIDEEIDKEKATEQEHGFTYALEDSFYNKVYINTFISAVDG